MQLGIFAKTFVRRTVEEVFDAVSVHPVRWVQFNFASAGLPSLPREIAPELLERIRHAAARHRLGLAAISGTFNMIHPDAARRREGLRRLGVVAGACPRLGTDLVTLCTGTRDPDDMWRHHPENASPEAWRDLLVTLTKALTVADKHEITLGVEPETGNVVDSARQARRLLDELRSPRLKIVLDAANLFRPGDLARMSEILDEAFDLLGNDLVLAHAKELAPDHQAAELAPGDGALDWEGYLRRLQEAGFTGPLIVHGITEAMAERALAFLKERLGTIPVVSRNR